MCVVGKEEELILIPLSGCGICNEGKRKEKNQGGRVSFSSSPQTPIVMRRDGGFAPGLNGNYISAGGGSSVGQDLWKANKTFPE